MSEEIKIQLVSAMRQFRHNNDNSPSLSNPEEGLVCAYDRGVTDRIVADLIERNRELETALAQQAVSVPEPDDCEQQSDDFKTEWKNGLPLDGPEAQWAWVGWQAAPNKADEHICVLNLVMNGRCLVCGSKQEEVSP